MNNSTTSNRFSFDLKEYIRRVHSLAIVTTDECQARCAHCLMSSGPAETTRLSIEKMKETVDFFVRNSSLKLVSFTGGESTLLEDDLLEVIAYCSELGIATRLVTNAYWASKRSEATKIIDKLREVGLYEINFSMDDFHAVWIPIDNLKNAWYSAKHMGFGTVLVAMCEGPISKVTSDYIKSFLEDEDIVIISRLEHEPEELPPPSSDGTRYLISKSNISRLGRGRKLRLGFLTPEPDYASYPKTIYGGCTSLFNPVTLNPDGSFGICCGIRTEHNIILSLSAATVFDSIEESQICYQDSLVLRAIQTVGPAILLRIVTGRASIIEELNIRSVCEACEILTTTDEYVDSLRQLTPLLSSIVCNYP
ncbi:radical SAM protein [Mobiluncus mulieris]|uniref:radical SAM protein n=1 Tax=Mobiluncus mulieris TaxID=2052 RepID=UPI00242D99E2|nr:radical SAM protein [Mobiluncus mulieris]